MQNDTCRIERKYATGSFDHETLAALLKLRRLPIYEEFPARSVHSLYFDRENLASLVDHRDGISERDKLRLRWYGQAGEDAKTALSRTDDVKLERKWRQGTVTGKPYWSLPTDNVRDATIHGVLGAAAATLPPAFPPELRQRLQEARAQCIVSYDRRYFALIGSRVRMTLDYNIRIQPARDLRHGSLAIPLGCEVLAELKFPPGEQETAKTFCQGLPWIAVKNSKYVRAMQILLDRF